MKRRYVAISILMIACMTLNGCASKKSSKSSGEEATIYGEVSKVDSDNITIKVGTLKKDQSDGGTPKSSELELTGEEKVVSVEKDTVIQREGMGAPPNQSASDGESMQKPDGNPPAQQETIALSDITVGDTISVSMDNSGKAVSITVMNGNMGAGAGAQGVDSYNAVTEISDGTKKQITGQDLSSTGKDENALLVSGGSVANVQNSKLSRNSLNSTGGDNASFYGVGAAALTTDGTLYVADSDIQTDAAGGTGIFAYGKGTVYAANTKITTKQDTSGGIHAAGGGTLYAWDMNVETNGGSAAAIRSDRGGGKMRIDGGTYTSNGTGSPAVYSTADIAVNNATLKANGSEAICIEGRNAIRLFDTSLTGNMKDDSQNDCTWNVILYQSMSGDSEEGNSIFEMYGGSLTAKNGGMFYTTNTESTITLSDVKMTYAEDNDFFLRCTGNQNQRGWGQSGQNGADCLFTAIKQEMEGDVIWDAVSKLDFYMTKDSQLKGAVKQDNSCAGTGSGGDCNFYIQKDSTWTVTGDSELSSLQNAGNIVDEKGKTVTIKGTDGKIYVKGDSQYSVVVGEYQEKADVSGASKASSASEYQEEKPSELG